MLPPHGAWVTEASAWQKNAGGPVRRYKDCLKASLKTCSNPILGWDHWQQTATHGAWPYTGESMPSSLRRSAYNAMQCNAMQCNAMQCNAMQCNAMQCNAMQCNAMQCNAITCYGSQTKYGGHRICTILAWLITCCSLG